MKGIAWLIGKSKGEAGGNKRDDKHAAYALLAMIYGLSFFRVHDFMPEDSSDNREIAFDLVRRLVEKS
ncbi:hypothetical protein D3C78_1947150 [compost metagenome]